MRAVSEISSVSGYSANSHLSSVSNLEMNRELEKLSSKGGAAENGAARTNTANAEENLVGTEHYISPEMIETKQCSYAGDLWAFGVILY